MPHLANPTFQAAGLAMAQGRTARPSWWPATVGQWVSIAGSALLGSPGVAVPAISPSGGSGPQSRVIAWNSLALKRRGSEVFLPGTGGHGDYPGNEVSSIALDADAPAWQLRRTYTPFAQILSDQPYNADGRPNSRHTWYGLTYIDALDRALLVGCGALWQSAAGGRKVDGFSPVSNDWDAAGTYADQVSGAGNAGQLVCKHPVTEDLYTIYNGGFQMARYNRLANSWALLASNFNAFPFPTYQSGALDPIRNCVFAFTTPASPAGAFGAGKYDLVTGARTAITFAASAANTALMAISTYYSALVFSRTRGTYLFYNGQAGLQGVIYEITPNSTTVWDVSVFATTGVTPATVPSQGINQRFIEAPELQGIFMLADYTSNFNFVRTT